MAHWGGGELLDLFIFSLGDLKVMESDEFEVKFGIGFDVHNCGVVMWKLDGVAFQMTNDIEDDK